MSLLYSTASSIGLMLSDAQLGVFSAFGDLLVKRSAHVNLTAIKDEHGIVIKHFLDSLSPAVYVPELARLRSGGGGGDGGGDDGEGDGGCGKGDDHPGPSSGSGNDGEGGGGMDSVAALIDIGTGAGFPGIPLKILYGEKLRVILIDSVRKKVDFINEAISVLGLDNCEALHIRAEDAARREDLRERFDFATARALAPLPKVYGYAMPFLRNGGIMIGFKGKRVSTLSEMAQLNLCLRGDTPRVSTLNEMAQLNLCLHGDTPNEPSLRMIEFKLPAGIIYPVEMPAGIISPVEMPAGIIYPVEMPASIISPGETPACINSIAANDGDYHERTIVVAKKL